MAQQGGGMKFIAHDIINNKPIDIFKVNLSKSGHIVSFEDFNGEFYGRHQVHLYVDVSALDGIKQKLRKEPKEEG